MRKLLLIIAMVALCAMCYALCDLYAQDKIAAVVNQDIITQKDVDDFTHFMRIQLSREYKGKELETKIQSMKLDLLNKLIEDRLILQEAKKEKFQPDESRVTAKISEIRKRYPSDIEFQSDLAKQGMTQADLENKIREQLIMYTMVEIKIRSKVIVRPEEVTSFYNANIKDFMTPEERQLTVVTLENEDQAKTFSYNFRSGQKLEDLATRYPITVNKLDAFKGEELRKDIEDVVFKMGIGEISNPVKIDGQYYIFKLENLVPPKQQSLSEAQGAVHDYLFNKKMQEALDKWLDELKKQSYVKIL